MTKDKYEFGDKVHTIVEFREGEKTKRKFIVRSHKVECMDERGKVFSLDLDDIIKGW